MRLLDLFCGAGGAAMGYHRAGYDDIVGVDHKPQLRYPFEFIQEDALDYLSRHGSHFDMIHASPPCQKFSVTAPLSRGGYPDLIAPVRDLLQAIGKPYVIENVPRAPLINPLMLCGTMFGLRVIRHRLFETNPVIWFPPFCCNHWGKATSANSKRWTPGRTISHTDGYDFITVCGHDYLVNEGRVAMGVDWMTQKELSQAIPPAYTEWIGNQILETV